METKKLTGQEALELIGRGLAGDKEALEELLASVQDGVWNLSLRMLGTVPDAQDASQEIYVRILTGLSSFKGESAFSTWAMRIAINHLKDYKKSMFAQHPLSFEYYGEDILNGGAGDLPDLSQGVDRALLEEELKLSCTNVMLQCLTPESRCIFILGTMFKVDSRLAGELLGMSAENYRQRLCRVRQKVAQFLSGYCGLAGGPCRCKKRVDYAIATHRLMPGSLPFTEMRQVQSAQAVKQAMEQVDDLSLVFEQFPAYRSPQGAREFLESLLRSERMQAILEA